MIEVEDIGDLINKGRAAFERCYECQSCAPLSHKCVSGHRKIIKWVKDSNGRLQFECSRFKEKEHPFDPNAW